MFFKFYPYSGKNHI